jgi:hypothetical protein
MMRGTGKRGLLAAGVVLWAATAANAMPLNLNKYSPFVPDIFSSYIDVTYTSATKSLVATGYPITFTPNGVAVYDFSDTASDWWFQITATVDGNGKASGGSIDVHGDVMGLSGEMLAGTLADFGYWETTDRLEFIFTPTSGDLASYYPLGIEVILNHAGYKVSKGFKEDFANSIGEGSADAYAAVPEPVTAMSLMSGLLAAGAYVIRRVRRPRRANQAD